MFYDLLIWSLKLTTLSKSSPRALRLKSSFPNQDHHRMDLAFLNNRLLINIHLFLQIKALAGDSQEHRALEDFLECRTEEYLQAGIRRPDNPFPHMGRLVANLLKRLVQLHNSNKMIKDRNLLHRLQVQYKMRSLMFANHSHRMLRQRILHLRRRHL
jgi:hypothetical protein